MDKIERVARALCLAEGQRPDEIVAAERFFPKYVPGFLPSEPEALPRWTAYRDQARRFVAAFEAMRAAELEPMLGATGTADDGG